jgi:uncharacterized protein YerC
MENLAHDIAAALQEQTLDNFTTLVNLGDETYRVVLSMDKYEGKSYRDRTWLVANYINNNRTMLDIATSCGVTAATINQWLVRFEIPTRGRGRRA